MLIVFPLILFSILWILLVSLFWLVRVDVTQSCVDILFAFLNIILDQYIIYLMSAIVSIMRKKRKSQVSLTYKCYTSLSYWAVKCTLLLTQTQKQYKIYITAHIWYPYKVCFGDIVLLKWFAEDKPYGRQRKGWRSVTAQVDIAYRLNTLAVSWITGCKPCPYRNKKSGLSGLQ